jgi:hypothetical protein
VAEVGYHDLRGGLADRYGRDGDTPYAFVACALAGVPVPAWSGGG